MPLRNPIADIVSQLPGAPKFIYGSSAEINYKTENVTADRPVVFLYPNQAISSTHGINGSVSNRFDIYMQFMSITKFERDSNDNEVIVNAMLALANLFLVRMRDYIPAGDNTRYFEFPEGLQAKSYPLYNKYDDNLTGVDFRITVKTRLDPYLLNC